VHPTAEDLLRNDSLLARTREGLARPALEVAVCGLLGVVPPKGSLQCLRDRLSAGEPLPRRSSGLAPAIVEGLSAAGSDRSDRPARLLAALALRERARTRVVQEQWAETQRLLVEEGMRARAIRGPAFAKRWYRQADLRHSHGITLAVQDAAARRRLTTRLGKDFGYSVAAQSETSSVLHAPQRIEVELRAQVLPFAGSAGGPQEPACTEVSEATELLAHALLARTRGAGRWILDLAVLAEVAGLVPEEWAAEVFHCGFGTSAAAVLDHASLFLPDDSGAADIVAATRDRLWRLTAGGGDSPAVSQAIEAVGRKPPRAWRRLLSGSRRPLPGSGLRRG